MDTPSSNTNANSTTIATSNSKTVVFDVGGTIYRVSRSLLGQHPDSMLARLASDTWNGVHGESNECDGKNDNNNDSGSVAAALFIERDGERFRYCLDFLRDGGIVDLPPTIPMNALLRDLEYYGFHDVDSSKICAQENENDEARLRSVLKISVDHIDCLQQDWKGFKKFALYCWKEHQKDGELTFMIGWNSRLYNTAMRLDGSEANENLFNIILRDIASGLKFKSFSMARKSRHRCKIFLDRV